MKRNKINYNKRGKTMKKIVIYILDEKISKDMENDLVSIISEYLGGIRKKEVSIYHNVKFDINQIETHFMDYKDAINYHILDHDDSFRNVTYINNVALTITIVNGAEFINSVKKDEVFNWPLIVNN